MAGIDAFETRLLDRLFEELIAEADKRTAGLVHPTAPDYPDYREKIGFIKGLLAAREMAVEIAKSLNSPEKKPEPPRQGRTSYED